MKKLIFSSLVIIFGTQIAAAVTITGDASVKIEKTLTTVQSQPMNFGTITPAPSPGIVTMTATGVRTSGSLGMYGLGAAGVFTITASPSTALNISFGNGVVTNGANNMSVDTFTTTSTPSGNTTDSSGSMALNVGANLNVGAAQNIGTYNGTYSVIVNY